MPAPGSLPSPNANHFINLCLIKWLVWNYPQLDTYPHSPGNAPLFFPSPRSFGSTQSSRRFLPILPQHSLTMFFLTFWSMFFALPEMKPKQCYKMTVPTSYCKKQALLQNDSPSKKHACYKMTWFSVTKCHFLFFQMPLKPGHGWPHFITEMGTGIHIIKCSIEWHQEMIEMSRLQDYFDYFIFNQLQAMCPDVSLQPGDIRCFSTSRSRSALHGIQHLGGGNHEFTSSEPSGLNPTQVGDVSPLASPMFSPVLEHMIIEVVPPPILRAVKSCQSYASCRNMIKQ